MDTLIRITEVFAQSVFLKYRKRRYGLKACTLTIEENLADDLRNLLIRRKEQEACGCTTPGSCTLSKIEERINTI
jgi:hypothetical protein